LNIIIKGISMISYVVGIAQVKYLSTHRMFLTWQIRRKYSLQI
jgi:hypothetical protein